MTNYKLTLVIHENNTSKIKGHLLLATFVEQENYIIFSPQFDVCGYGKTLEAKVFIWVLFWAIFRVSKG